jgi:hypothetical protein
VIPSVRHTFSLFVLISQLRSTSCLDVPLVIPPSLHTIFHALATSPLDLQITPLTQSEISLVNSIFLASLCKGAKVELL